MLGRVLSIIFLLLQYNAFAYEEVLKGLEVTADDLEISQKSAKFIGNVHMFNDAIQFNADILEITFLQEQQNDFLSNITNVKGVHAYMKDDKQIHASLKQNSTQYSIKCKDFQVNMIQKKIHMENAEVYDGNTRLTGNITYDMNTNQMSITGDAQKRVKIVIKNGTF